MRKELSRIPEIVFEESPEKREGILSLKELFQKENMDFYHVDCLILCKIARNMLQIQKELRNLQIYPGLYDLEDIYVDIQNREYPLYLCHSERFQFQEKEQDYEWYPEDERIFGDIVFFDAVSQLMADQRLLYKILTASYKGNVKTPPLASGRDYSSLFYGTLPAYWKEVFEKEIVLSHSEWESNLTQMIESEEHFEKMAQDRIRMDSEEEKMTCQDAISRGKEIMRVLYIILRTECKNSLEISQMLYETQEKLENIQEHGKFSLQQGFLFGDGVIRHKKFAEYPTHFRIQVPQVIKEYSVVEALLIACEWMMEMIHDSEDSQAERYENRIYIMADGKIENNAMFRECLQRIQQLKAEGCDIKLLSGKNASCEGWSNLESILGQA